MKKVPPVTLPLKNATTNKKKSPFKWKRLPSVRESTKERSGKNILSPHINNDNNVVIRFGAVAAFEKAFMDCF